MEWTKLTIIVTLIILMPFIYKGSKDGLNNFFRSLLVIIIYICRFQSKNK